VDPGHWERIKDVYRRALNRDERERRAFVEAECGEDAALAAEILRLLDVSAEDSLALDQIVESAAESMAASLPEEREIGQYRLLEVLGFGGMGYVYLAERADREYEQLVAIKTINLGLATPTIAERFRQERQILANLDHPNIARLLDGGRTEAGVPYLVMEYIDGESILDYCAARQLPLDRRIDLFLHVCDAVQHAHRQLIVHRDIKPSNILVTREGVPKLLDFGIAKLLDTGIDEALTRVEARVLTPEYASPEQILGEPVTQSTDVYALGVLLYELLSGAKPFRATPASSQQSLRTMCETTPAEPSRAALAAGDRERSARLAGDLDRIVMKAIRREPERRYETVRDLAEDVRNYRAGRPVSARAPSWSYRTAKFIRRNRTAVAASVTAVVAAIVMTVFYTARLADERDRASLAASEAEEVSGFLATLFRGASPSMAQGETLTALELLETGSERIGRLEAQPVLKAKLYHVLGDSYTQLGAWDKGRELLEIAVALLESAPNAEPLLLADAVGSLAEVHRLAERHETAIAAFRRALEIRRDRLGDEHPDVAFAMAKLGGALGWQGRSAEALDLLRQAIAIKTRLGEQDEELLDVLGITAVNLAQIGRFEEAIEINRRSIDLSMELLGELHPSTVIRIGNSGVFMHQAYRTQEGLRLLDEAIDKSERIRPDDHPNHSYDRRWRARMLQRLGRFDEAAIELERAIAITEAGGRSGSMEDVSNLYALGRWRLEYGHPGAYDAYQEGLALAKERAAPDSPAVYAGQVGSAIALARDGDFSAAEELLTEVLARQDRMQKSVEWYARKELATVLSQQSRFDEASGHFARIFEEQENGPDAPGGAAIEALIDRAAHHRRAGSIDRAEADARLARDIAAERLPANTWIVALADLEIARAMLENGSSAEARARLNDATDRLRRSFHPDDPRVSRLEARFEARSGR